MALDSDLPRGDWRSDEHSARDLYNELPLTQEVYVEILSYITPTLCRTLSHGSGPMK